MTFAPVEHARSAVKKAMNLAGNVDDADAQAGVLLMEWSCEFMSGNHGAALMAAQQIAAVARRGGDTTRLSGDRILGASLLFSGNLTDAHDHLQRAVDFYVAPSDGHHSTPPYRDPRVIPRARLARVLSLRGCMDRAYTEARSSFEMAQASGTGITVCWVVHGALCPIALMMGDLIAAESAIVALSDWATRMNATLWKMMATCWKGSLLIECGEYARGIELLSPALEACEQSGWQMGYVQFLSSLAEGLARLGRLKEAGSKLERAIAWAEENERGVGIRRSSCA